MPMHLLSIAAKLLRNKPYIYVFINTYICIQFCFTLINPKGSINKNLGYPCLL